jgi:alanyl-tRNA synthetase
MTHVMNRALRDQVNPDAQQKGSLVDDEKTRFDFSHGKALTPEELDAVEKQVNDDIAADLAVYATVAPQPEARKINGLRAVFGEKYPPKVRVVTIGVRPDELLANPGHADWAKFSVEFCGGTHLARTAEAERFVIVQEEAVGRGVRRLTALTGAAAQEAAAHGQALLRRVSAVEEAKLAEEFASLTAATQETVLPMRVRQKLQSQLAELQKKLKETRKQESREAAGGVVDAARRIAESADGKIIVSAIEGADAKTLRTAMDVIKKKNPGSALLLGAVAGDKISFVAAVPKPLIDQGLKAGDWIRQVAQVAGGGGGGRPDMAQAGGKDPSKLEQALETAKSFAAAKLG